MAIKKINQINYAGETYEFVDDKSQAEMLVLEQKVDRLYNTSTTAINEETARAKAAEAAILSTQVAREAGKGLSTNDFTNYYKGYIDSPTLFSIETATEPAHKGVVPGPAMGDAEKFLKADGTWSTPHDTTYANATHSVSGLMSYTDKTRFDNMEDANVDALGSTTVIGDGVVTTTYSNGKIHKYEFNDNGTISETLTSSYGRTTHFTITFNNGTITREEVTE